MPFIASPQLERLNQICAELMIDGSYLLRPRVLSNLRAASRMLEQVGDRSFRIAGYYSMTPGTIGPVSKHTSDMPHRK